MKKICFLAIMATALFSCKKEEVAGGNTAVLKEETQNTETPRAALFDIARSERTVAQVNEHLSQKNNDTLYVTNFFATWCGPCMREIPHFKEKIAELSGKPVKFTFVSLDEKTAWPTDVKNFVEENNLQNNTILLDAAQLPEDFFAANFRTWDGQSIPFTLFSRGTQRDEFVGMLMPEELDAKLKAMMAQTAPVK